MLKYTKDAQLKLGQTLQEIESASRWKDHTLIVKLTLDKGQRLRTWIHNNTEYFSFFCCHTDRNSERITWIYLYSIYIHKFMHCAFFLATFFNKFVYKNCSFSSPYCLFGWEKGKQRCCNSRYGSNWNGDWNVTAAIFQLSNQNIKPITFND